jgi:Acyl-CoA carboxylase epsilon subunit
VTPRIRVTAGGAPTAAQLAALTSALTSLVDEEAATAPDPVPPVYRSRWRRAGVVETTEVPPHPKDGGPAWGGRP